MTTKTKRQYTEEFKREAVKLVTEQGYKVSEAARNLGVHVSLLRRWKERLEAEQFLPRYSSPRQFETIAKVA